MVSPLPQCWRGYGWCHRGRWRAPCQSVGTTKVERRAPCRNVGEGAVDATKVNGEPLAKVLVPLRSNGEGMEKVLLVSS
jgi:hypothetical protein